MASISRRRGDFLVIAGGTAFALLKSSLGQWRLEKWVGHGLTQAGGSNIKLGPTDSRNCLVIKLNLYRLFKVSDKTGHHRGPKSFARENRSWEPGILRLAESSA